MLGVIVQSSGTPGVGGQLFAAHLTVPSAAITGLATGVVVASASNGSISSNMFVKSTVTITTPAAPKWFPVAECISANVGAFPGSGMIVNRQVQGRISIQPGQGLALATMALAGTSPLYSPIAEWVEIAVDDE